MDGFWMDGPGFWLIILLGLCGFLLFVGEYGLTVFKRITEFMLEDDEEEGNKKQ